MGLSTLNEWLSYIQSMSQQSIQLGLDRVKTVGERLAILKPKAHVVTVAGTNGKGSTIATLEQIYLAAGYSVGSFTSPYLLRYTEQIRLHGVEVTDTILCEAFTTIAAARGDILLTPFEWLSLAAFYIFKNANVDIILLEVGLGGRLDAVNCIDTNLAIVTSISLDHCEYLGDTRDKIGYEKAGIFRSNVPAIFGDDDIPQSILTYAQQINARLLRQGIEFGYLDEGSSWIWKNTMTSEAISDLPHNGLYLKNLSTALTAIQLAQKQYPVTLSHIKTGLKNVQLKARVQVIGKNSNVIMDVAHNPAACNYLVTRLQKMPVVTKTFALFSMLADKDILASILPLKAIVDEWHVPILTINRAADLVQLKMAFKVAGISQVTFYQNMEAAYAALLPRLEQTTRLIVFGSFHTVGEVLPLWDAKAVHSL